MRHAKAWQASSLVPWVLAAANFLDQLQILFGKNGSLVFFQMASRTGPEPLLERIIMDQF
jgi:hypothetical protein